MANPQLEDGHTKIVNEILDKIISANLSGQEIRVALFVIRKTYGFNKSEDYISLSQIMSALGISKTRASQVVNALGLMKILTVTENINGLTKKYKFAKDFDSWDIPLRKTLTVKEKRNRPLRKSVTTKDNITKDNKERGKNIPPSLFEITTYCKERNNGIDPEAFLSFYQSKNWMIGKNKMKDWHAAIITWEKRAPKAVGASW